MFGSATLEIAIGLAFVYLLFSLACTSLTEGIARVLRLRASTLKYAIYNMIVGEIGDVKPKDTNTTATATNTPAPTATNTPLPTDMPTATATDTPLPNDRAGNVRPKDSRSSSQAAKELQEQLQKDFVDKRLYQHGLIRSLAKSSRYDNTLAKIWFDKGRPSYIPASTFALALIGTIINQNNTTAELSFKTLKEAVKDENNLPNNLAVKSILEIFLDRSQTKVDKGEDGIELVQKQIEAWYNDVMERVRGWYTRKTRVIVVILAFLVTIAMNVDTLAIASALSRDITLRNSVVNAADKFLTANSNLPSVAPAGGTASNGEIGASQPFTLTLGQLEEEIAGLALPIGWVRMQPSSSSNWLTAPFVTDLITATTPVTITPQIQAQYAQAQKDRRTLPVNWGKKLPGLLLTMIMLSLGAPFWFDRLNQLVNLRSTGKPPQ